MALQVKMKVSRAKEMLTPNPDMLWLAQHYQKLRRKYPDKWVAVKDSSVVLVENELEPLLEGLKKQHGTTLGFAVEFIGTRTRNMIL